MTKASLEGNHSRWSFTSLTIICMVSTFALGWCLLQDFLSELLQSRDKDKLYGDIMHTGLIVCIFNISKFYLLLCFGKKLEIVDLVDSKIDGNSTEENDNEFEDVYEGDRDDHEGETQGQVIMEGQHAQPQGLEREQGGGENRADHNMDAEQYREGQNFPEIQDGQNLHDDLDGTNRQDNEQVQGEVMEGQHAQPQGHERDQGGGENRADLNMDAEQNREQQNFSENQDGQNLQDDLGGTNRQDNAQVQGQISQDYEGSEERVLAPDDNQVHMPDTGNKNIQPRRSTRNTMSGRSRSQSISEGQNYESSSRQDDQNIEPRKLQRSSIFRRRNI